MRGTALLGRWLGGLTDEVSRARHVHGNEIIDDRIEFQDPVVVRAYRGWLAPIVTLRRKGASKDLAA